jgi:hypothetical protein
MTSAYSLVKPSDVSKPRELLLPPAVLVPIYTVLFRRLASNVQMETSGRSHSPSQVQPHDIQCRKGCETLCMKCLHSLRILRRAHLGEDATLVSVKIVVFLLLIRGR